MQAKLLALAILLMVPGTTSFAQDSPPDGNRKISEDVQGDEISRVKIVNQAGELLSRELQFADRMERHQYFEDGKVKEKLVLDKNGTELAQFLYFPDGKLKKEIRDGVLRFERRKLADGTHEAIRFKSDGKRPQMRRRVGPVGQFELTHFREGKNNAIWFTATINGTSGEFEWMYYGKTGASIRRVQGATNMITTVFDETGNFKLEQVWAANQDGTYTIKSATIREGNDFKRYLVDDKGNLTGVELLDTDGSVISTFKPAQVAAPNKSLFKEQYEDDDPTVPGSPLVPH